FAALAGGSAEAAPACRKAGHPCEGNQECCEGLVCVDAPGPGQAARCVAPTCDNTCGTNFVQQSDCSCLCPSSGFKVIGGLCFKTCPAGGACSCGVCIASAGVCGPPGFLCRPECPAGQVCVNGTDCAQPC